MAISKINYKLFLLSLWFFLKKKKRKGPDRGALVAQRMEALTMKFFFSPLSLHCQSKKQHLKRKKKTLCPPAILNLVLQQLKDEIK